MPKPTTVVASGAINNSDQLDVELHQPADLPAFVLIKWPSAPSVASLDNFDNLVAAVYRVLADAAPPCHGNEVIAAPGRPTQDGQPRAPSRPTGCGALGGLWDQGGWGALRPIIPRLTAAPTISTARSRVAPPIASRIFCRRVRSFGSVAEAIRSSRRATISSVTLSGLGHIPTARRPSPVSPKTHPWSSAHFIRMYPPSSRARRAGCTSLSLIPSAGISMSTRLPDSSTLARWRRPTDSRGCAMCQVPGRGL
jgi:hypothetical protein